MNSTRLPESSGLKGVIGRMSNAPELELIYGALAEISDRLEKINKTLEKINKTLDLWLEQLNIGIGEVCGGYPR